MDRAPEPTRTVRRHFCRQVGEGSHLIKFPNLAIPEMFLSLSALPGEPAAGLFQRLYEFMARHLELRIIRQDVFGAVPDGATSEPKAYRLNGREWPVTWVASGHGDGQPVAGIQVHAVDARKAAPVRWRGRTVGACFEDESATYCVLAGLEPTRVDATRAAQAREVLELMEEVLTEAGLSFREVIRTWFYLDDILDWYGEFNQVRNRFFTERGVYHGLIPASTGVGGGNASGTALVADLLAVRPREPGVACVAVPSPLQSAAVDYGSSFSRAVELQVPGQRRLYISGTASILPDGRTAHAGDAVAQVALTMEVVEAILKSRGMDWSDAVRGIAYFKHMEDAPALRHWLASQGATDCPLIVAKNDICRDDLLYEIELDAVALAPQ